ncbi:MAG: hypothetical protein KAR31_03350, partial [Candidatus Omnitrophica bacterium]|nr:hypothetical protein [Candidatus Omnitrophota bacterium]
SGKVQRVDREIFNSMLSSPQYVKRMQPMRTSSPIYDTSRPVNVERYVESVKARDTYTRKQAIPAQIVRMAERIKQNVNFDEAKLASDLVFRFAHSSGDFAIFGGSVKAISDWLMEKGVAKNTANVTARVEVMRRDICDVTYRIESVQGTLRFEDRVGSSWNANVLARRIVEAKVNTELASNSVSIIPMPAGFNDYAAVVNELSNIDRGSILIVDEQGGKNVFYDANGRMVDIKTVNQKVNVIIGRANTPIHRTNKDVRYLFDRASADNEFIDHYRIDAKRDIRRIDGRSYDVTRMGSDYASLPLAMRVSEAVEKGFRIDEVQVLSAETDTKILNAILSKGGELRDFTVIVRTESGKQRLLISPDVAYEIASGRRTSLLKQDNFGKEFSEVSGIASIRVASSSTKQKPDWRGRLYESLVGRIVDSRTARGIDIVKYDGELTSLRVGEAIDIVQNAEAPMLGDVAFATDGYDYGMTRAAVPTVEGRMAASPVEITSLVQDTTPVEFVQPRRAASPVVHREVATRKLFAATETQILDAMTDRYQSEMTEFEIAWITQDIVDLQQRQPSAFNSYRNLADASPSIAQIVTDQRAAAR